MKKNLSLLFFSRSLRLFSFGFSSLILVLFLSERGFSMEQVGLLLTATLLGDGALSLFLSTRADRIGRRRILILGGLLMVFSGILMATSGIFWLIALGMTLGVISPSGGEVGPFLPIEQAAMTQSLPDSERTRYIAWYHLAGFCSTALGALCGGYLTTAFQAAGWSALQSYENLFWLYAFIGILLIGVAWKLEILVEATPPQEILEKPHWSGLKESRTTIFKLSLLFSLDSFAGGFIVKSILVYWFHQRFAVSESTLGLIFCGASLLSGSSALLAAPLAKRFGLLNTMVFTHLPSNILLMMIPLMPTLTTAVIVFLIRNLICQMDVPTRQSYVMAVVPAFERSAANGITHTARSLGSSFSPALGGMLLGVASLISAPFFIAGFLKIVYDLALYVQFKSVKPPEEKQIKY